MLNYGNNISHYRVTAPSALAVSLEDAKAFLRYESTEEDALVTNLIEAVTVQAESFTRRKFIQQTWRLAMDDFPRYPSGKYDWIGQISLPFPPAISVSHVKYYDSAGTLQTLTPNTDYLVLAEDMPARIVPAPNQVWPDVMVDRADAVQIDFVCGYGAAASNVPAGIRQAMLIMLAHYFENRQAVAPVQMHELPLACEHLLWPYRDLRFYP